MHRILLLLPLVAGCAIEPHATPAELVELEAAEGAVETAKATAEAATARAVQATEGIVQALAQEDPAVLAAAVAEAQDALADAEAAGVSLDASLAAYEAIHGPIRERVVEGAGQILIPFLPPPFNGPLGLLIGQGAAMLAFERSRKHLGTAAQAAARLKLVAALNAALKALGMKHTSPATENLARAQGEA